MKDEDKTKEQLINELLALRQRVTELEALETERQVAEEALARERNLLRTLIDNLPDYIYAMDTEGRFVLANTTIAHYLGAASPDELLGKTNFDFYPPALAARNHALDQEIMQSGQPVVNLEESFIDLAGNPVWFLTTGACGHHPGHHRAQAGGGVCPSSQRGLGSDIRCCARPDRHTRYPISDCACEQSHGNPFGLDTRRVRWTDVLCLCPWCHRAAIILPPSAIAQRWA